MEHFVNARWKFWWSSHFCASVRLDIIAWLWNSTQYCHKCVDVAMCDGFNMIWTDLNSFWMFLLVFEHEECQKYIITTESPFSIQYVYISKSCCDLPRGILHGLVAGGDEGLWRLLWWHRIFHAPCWRRCSSGRWHALSTGHRSSTL